MTNARMTVCARALLLSTALVAPMTILSAPAQAAAQDQATVNLNIPAQDLGAALSEFVRQSRQQLLYAPELARGKKSSAVNGNMSAEAGLRQLLLGTDLKVSTSSGGAFVLSTGNQQGNALAGAPNAGTENASSSGGDDATSDQAGISEILVVGSRSQNVDIKRTENGSQPYVVFSHEEIEKSSATTVEDFLRSRLPMNGQVGSNNTTGSGQIISNNVNTINLRGLGPTQTLVLIDGRRVARGFVGTQGFQQTDINGIPLSAIDRIEILPSTAGGIYGGGAVGGVVNIVRRRDYKGINVSLGFDAPFGGGAERFRAEVTGGFSPDHGATQVTFSASRVHSDPLRAGDNDLTRRGRELYEANDPAHAPFAAGTSNIQAAPIFDISTPGCNFANFQTCFSTPNLVLDNGTPLNSNHTFVPNGYGGPATDSGLALISNAGHYNTALSNDGFGSKQNLMNGSDITALNLNVRTKITDSIDAFVDLSSYKNAIDGSYIGAFNGVSPNVVTLSPNAPGNPFQQTINVFYPIEPIARPLENKSSVLSSTLGAVAKISSSWTANLEYDWSRSKSHTRYSTRIFDTSLQAALQNNSINVLSDLSLTAPNFTAYEVPELDSEIGPTTTEQHLVSARIGGNVASLPGGQIHFTGLAEYRNESAKSGDFLSMPTAAGPRSVTVVPGREQKVLSGYGEIVVPIFSAANAVKFFRSLQFQGSVRYDSYKTTVASPTSYNASFPPSEITHDTTTVDAASYTTSLTWTPFNGLMFRGSAASGFLPPAIDQLVSSTGPGFSFLNILDPLRGNQRVGTSAAYQIVSSGNPKLEPERSHSFSIGVVVEPASISGLRVSADFTKIRKTKEISTVDLQSIVDNEASLPGRIVRGPNLAADPPGYAGPIILIDQSYLNISRSKIAAWDFQLDYNHYFSNVGEFHFYSVISHQTSLRRQILPSSAAYDTVGYREGPLSWRGNVGVDWKLGPWSAGWNGQFYDSYKIRSGVNTESAFSDLQVALQGSEKIPSQFYNDLYVSFNFKESNLTGFGNTAITLGVQNIFDHRPPAIAQLVSGYSPYGDPRLRRLSLQITNHF